jgi:hypothetical protein
LFSFLQCLKFIPGEINNYLIDESLNQVRKTPALPIDYPNHTGLKIRMQPKIRALCLVFIAVTANVSVAAMQRSFFDDLFMNSPEGKKELVGSKMFRIFTRIFKYFIFSVL